MRIETLKEELESARAVVVRITDEQAQLDKHNKELQDAVNANFKAQTQLSHEKFDAQIRVYDLEADVECEVARQVAEECIRLSGGCSREILLAELRQALRSKKGREAEIVRWLERRRRYRGGREELAGAVELTYPQRERVIKTLDRICPRHPETGKWLPPYVVVETETDN